MLYFFQGDCWGIFSIESVKDLGLQYIHLMRSSKHCITFVVRDFSLIIIGSVGRIAGASFFMACSGPFIACPACTSVKLGIPLPKDT